MSWFCIWCTVMVQLHSFARGWPVFPELFVAATILSPLYGLGTFVQDHLTISLKVYFRVLYSVPLACISVFMPQCFDYCIFVMCFEIRTCEASSFVSFSRLFWLFGVLRVSVLILGWIFLFWQKKKKNVIGILIRITSNL